MVSRISMNKEEYIKKLDLELYEECNSETLYKFIKEHKTGNISPLRFLKLFRYLAKPDSYANLNKEYKNLVDKFVKDGIIKIK